MIEWSVEHGIPLRADPSELAEVIGRGRLLVVAQELQESLGGQLNACLSDVLHSGDTKPSNAHRALRGTDWVVVLTSNYDALIEGAYALESEGVLPPVFSAKDVNHAVDCLRNSKFFVFKVHGDLNIPGSIALGNRDYSRLMYLSPAYRSFLETVFASYTVLFVGFGGNDPDLDAVVDRLSAIYERSIGQHFLLISEGEFSALERRRLLEDKRLDCITYERDTHHSQVGEFLKALSLRAAPGGEVPTPRSSLPKKGLGRSFRVATRKLHFFAGSQQSLSVWVSRVGSLTRKSQLGTALSTRSRRPSTKPTA